MIRVVQAFFFIFFLIECDFSKLGFLGFVRCIVFHRAHYVFHNSEVMSLWRVVKSGDQISRFESEIWDLSPYSVCFVNICIAYVLLGGWGSLSIMKFENLWLCNFKVSYNLKVAIWVSSNGSKEVAKLSLKKSINCSKNKL